MTTKETIELFIGKVSALVGGSKSSCSKGAYFSVLKAVLISEGLLDKKDSAEFDEIASSFPASPEAMKGLQAWHGEASSKKSKALKMVDVE